MRGSPAPHEPKRALAGLFGVLRKGLQQPDIKTKRLRPRLANFVSYMEAEAEKADCLPCNRAWKLLGTRVLPFRASQQRNSKR